MEDCESRLQKLNDEFEEFAYIVSHDLKAPVRAVYNLAGWLEEDLAGNLPGDSAENFRLLKNRITRLDKMIGALLDFSRVPRYDLEITTVDIAKQISVICAGLTSTQKADFKILGHIPLIETYASKLHFVLHAILQNAVFFNDKTQPVIKIMLKEESESIRIIIEDNGPGVANQNIAKLFTMFYTTKPKDTLETTGAGLAIANKIVTFAGGKIFAENTNNGFSVTVIWPKILPSI